LTDFNKVIETNMFDGNAYHVLISTTLTFDHLITS